MYIVLIIALILIGIAALIMELFLPTAGIIGIIGGGCIIAGITFTYRWFGPLPGTLVLMGSIIAVPLIVFGALKIFPGTFFGKIIILNKQQNSRDGYVSYSSEKYRDLQGKNGIALTSLRPSGMVEINNSKYSVITSGEFIEKDTPVTVLKVEGSKIIVKQG